MLKVTATVTRKAARLGFTACMVIAMAAQAANIDPSADVKADYEFDEVSIVPVDEDDDFDTEELDTELHVLMNKGLLDSFAIEVVDADEEL